MFSFPVDKYPEVELLDHMVVLFLIFGGNSILFPVGAAPIYFPPAVHKGFLFSTLSPAFVVCRFSDDAHSNWCEVIPHGSFDLHFSNN